MATKKMSYEVAMKKLEEIVGQIESDELDIDNLSAKLKEAKGLMAYCKDRLFKADEEIRKLLDEDGE